MESSAAMRRHLSIPLAALILLISVAALAADGIAGTYVGDYTNKAGKSGGYQLTFTPGPDGRWTGEVIAVLDGRPTKSTMTSLVVEGDSIEAAHDFEVKGHKDSEDSEGQPCVQGSTRKRINARLTPVGPCRPPVGPPGRRLSRAS